MKKPVRVVIADDHQVVREGLQLILADSDGEIIVVGEASDGEEAVRLATSIQPDVVLMDLSMPRVDGLEATRRLREAGVPSRVLILTSFADGEGVRDAVRAGVTGYLMKDVLKAELLTAIRLAADGVPTLHPRAQQHLMRGIAEPQTPSPFGSLTPRERDVLALIARGESNKRIAAALNLSIGTVKGYVSAIFEKLGVEDRTQAALLVAKHDAPPPAR
ncbi:MAG TPA: response regulator transcription factor [Gemmatimonadaceae bacterium]|nr:response regulator transcription factor [Gemmatimonadaceae bacterium]